MKITISCYQETSLTKITGSACFPNFQHYIHHQTCTIKTSTVKNPILLLFRIASKDANKEPYLSIWLAKDCGTLWSSSPLVLVFPQEV